MISDYERDQAKQKLLLLHPHWAKPYRVCAAAAQQRHLAVNDRLFACVAGKPDRHTSTLQRFMWLAHMRREPPGCYLLDISWMVFISIFLVLLPQGEAGCLLPPPHPPKRPQTLQTLDCNRTENNPGSKPSLCLATQRKHQPADYLVFALSTNTMQKETIGLPEQLFFSCFFVCFFFFDCIVF